MFYRETHAATIVWSLLCLCLTMAPAGCIRTDPVARQLDEIEHLLDILEEERNAEEMVADLESYVKESRDRRVAIARELDQRSIEGATELELTHGDRLERLMHRLAIARRHWRETLRDQPELLQRFRQATRTLSNLYVGLNQPPTSY